jgi:hypothetical protein
MAEDSGNWSNYSKLVLKELVRLNEDSSKVKEDMDSGFKELNSKLIEINTKLGEMKSIESKIESHAKWIEKTNEIWSISQMKEAKDEIYQQKSRWVAAIAIISFIQILLTIGVSIWSKIR